jgi:putative endonuclease
MDRYYVYTLLSLKDGNLYTGRTTDLRRRLSEHARGEVASTQHRRPLKLVHYEYFIDKEDAVAREKFLKSGYGRKNLKKALKRTLDRLP